MERLNTADGDYDERDWDAFTFTRTGKNFAKKPPCKFHPLGTCTKGKNCKYSHSHYKDTKHHAVVAQEDDPEAYYEEEEDPVVPTGESQTAEVAAAAKAKGKGRKGKGKGKGKKGKGKKGR